MTPPPSPAVDQPSCFNCDSAGGGYYRKHEGETKWYLGLDQSGQAHFACAECMVLLFNCVAVGDETSEPAYGELAGDRP